MRGQPAVWTVMRLTPRFAASMQASATMWGMSWYLRSRKTRSPSSTRARTMLGPAAVNRRLPTLKNPGRPCRRSTRVSAWARVGTSRATMRRLRAASRLLGSTADAAARTESLPGRNLAPTILQGSVGGAIDFDAHRGQALLAEAQNFGGRFRDVDLDVFRHRAPVVDEQHGRAAVAQVGDPHHRARPQGPVRGGQSPAVVGDAAGRRPAVEPGAVPTGFSDKHLTGFKRGLGIDSVLDLGDRRGRRLKQQQDQRQRPYPQHTRDIRSAHSASLDRVLVFGVNGNASGVFFCGYVPKPADYHEAKEKSSNISPGFRFFYSVCSVPLKSETLAILFLLQ